MVQTKRRAPFHVPTDTSLILWDSVFPNVAQQNILKTISVKDASSDTKQQQPNVKSVPNPTIDQPQTKHVSAVIIT